MLTGDLRDKIDAIWNDFCGGLSNPLQHRRLVEKYADESAWARLDADARHELTERVSGLPRSSTTICRPSSSI